MITLIRSVPQIVLLLLVLGCTKAPEVSPKANPSKPSADSATTEKQTDEVREKQAQQKQAEEERESKLVALVKKAKSWNQKPSRSPDRLQGKALILYSENEKEKYPTHSLLPETLRGTLADPELVIFLVRERHEKRLSHLEVRLVDWSTGDFFGIFALTYETNSYDYDLKSWVTSCWTRFPKENEKWGQEELSTKLIALANEAMACDQRPSQLPTKLQGKAIILYSGKDGIDSGKKGKHPIHDNLPKLLQGEPGDPELVLFLVTARYTSGTQSFQIKPQFGAGRTVSSNLVVFNVRVVDWKSKAFLGAFELVGAEPPALDIEGLSYTEADLRRRITGTNPDLVSWVSKCWSKFPP